jgi:hypothetical protein
VVDAGTPGPVPGRFEARGGAIGEVRDFVVDDHSRTMRDR